MKPADRRIELLPAFAYGPRPSGVTPAERESDLKRNGLGSVAFCAVAMAACSMAACSIDGNGSTPDVTEVRSSIVGPSTLGGRNEVVMLYARFVTTSGAVGTRFCSGSYFAPRVVTTAAHCLTDIFADQLFVYYGDNFDADIGQLVDGPERPRGARARATVLLVARRLIRRSTRATRRISTTPTSGSSTWIASCRSIPCPCRARRWRPTAR